tara:strand:- start:539 stop:841 length:303 start_codon:yes stop_codon:yes gene_type:complete
MQLISLLEETARAVEAYSRLNGTPMSEPLAYPRRDTQRRWELSGNVEDCFRVLAFRDYGIARTRCGQVDVRFSIDGGRIHAQVTLEDSATMTISWLLEVA